MQVACNSGWDCLTSSGSFNRTEDCLLGEEIVLSGNLRITGRSDLTKITSAPQSRHFTIRAGTS